MPGRSDQRDRDRKRAASSTKKIEGFFVKAAKMGKLSYDFVM